MRSRAVQLTLSATALAAVVAAAFVLYSSEQRIAISRTGKRAFDAVVRDTTSSVAEFRGESVTKSLAALRGIATTGTARAALDDAAAKADNFTEIAAVLDQLNAARIAEVQAADEIEAAARKVQAITVGAAAVVLLGVIAGMVLLVPKPLAEPTQLSLPSTGVAPSEDLLLRADTPMTTGYVPSRPAGPVLRAASQLCTDFGRVSDAEELRQLIGRAAELMDASGLIVWVSAADGAQLAPAVSHGYLPEMIARLPPLARSADNAAACAFRTSQLQIVLARPGESNGAIVAPVLSSGGCVGVLSAEIRGGGETSESVQALAAIFAAHLAGVLHGTPESHEQRAAATGTGPI
jgi:hypothetical protein